MTSRREKETKTPFQNRRTFLKMCGHVGDVLWKVTRLYILKNCLYVVYYLQSHYLQIIDTSLKSFDLVSLTRISSSNVLITKNANLCYTGLEWRSIMSSSSQIVQLIDNKNYSACGKYNCLYPYS